MRIGAARDDGTGLAQFGEDRVERIGLCAGQRRRAARRRHRREKRPGLDAVGHDRVRRAGQARHAFDRDAVRPRAVDVRPHRSQAAREVDDLRLARGVLEDRGAVGKGCRHHQVLGPRDRDHVEDETHAGEPLRARTHIAVLEIDLGAHRHESLDVLVDGAQPDRAAARKRHPRLAAARDQRAERQDRRPHRLHELVGRERPVDGAGVELDGAGIAGVDADAHLREQPLHRPHVVEPRDVGEDERLVAKERRAQERQRGVLGARDADFAAERVAAVDDEPVHVSACPSAARPIAPA